MTLEENIFCAALTERVKEYMQSEENRMKFEDWYKERYGKSYEQQEVRKRVRTRIM